MLSILDIKPLPDEKSSPGSKPSEPPGVFAAEPAASTTRTQSEPAESSQTRSASQNTAASPAASPITASSAKSSEPVKRSTRPALRTDEVPVSEPVNIPEEPHEEPAIEAEAPGGESDWELVLGRRQVASWLFVGTLLIAMFSAASYYVGRMSAPNPLKDLDGKSEAYVAPPLPAATIAPSGQDPNRATNTGATAASTTPGIPPAAAAPASPISSVPGTIIREWNNTANSSGAGEPPLFANPQPGALYLQMGAVDKGVAVVLAEGLRRHGFNSLVAPGPSEKIFRVLIGPFATQEDFKRAKAEVDAIDLGTFARRFQN